MDILCDQGICVLEFMKELHTWNSGDNMQKMSKNI